MRHVRKVGGNSMAEKMFMPGGSEYISYKIRQAVENETRTAVITGN